MGGFGAVYRATQAVIERQVAIKIILPQYADHPDFIRRFEAEAQLVARLEHPYIVPLYDYWREPTAAYLVMRLMRGGSLQAKLNNHPLPLETTLRLMQGVGAALHSAHRAGVIHRDIKPANILLDEDDNGYLADFGFAKNLGNPNLAAHTEVGAVIGSLAYLSPEQIQAEPVTPRSDIYGLGVVLFELLTGQKPFSGPSPVDFIQQHLNQPLPPLESINTNGALDQQKLIPLNPIIARSTAKNPLDRYPDVEAMLADIRQSLQLTAAPSIFSRQTSGKSDANKSYQAELENPFKGLRPFGEADAASFFGRDTLIQDLLERLNQETELARFLAVVGPSGSGKSSVVKAGLIPALRQGGLPGSEKWFIVEMMPGNHPLEELEAALLRVAVNPPASLLTQLQENDRGLLRAARLILPTGEDDAELVLVIDQFEELFTQCEDETTRTHFLNSLVTATLDPHSQLWVIITLRADFTDRPLQYVDFGELVRRRTEFVLPLTPDELEEAITQPSRQVGLSLEPGLPAAIIRDLGDQPGMLPLLQYALTELFERRVGNALTLGTYQSSGGIKGALASRADELYQSLGKNGQRTARRLFLRLVAVGEGVEDTRRRVLRSELEDIEGSEDQPGRVFQNPKSKIQNVIDSFGRYRLLTFDHDPVTRGPTVEVAHEALIREWSRLRQWLDEDREFLFWQQRLRAGLHQWQTSEYDEGALLRGAPLAEAENWLNQRRIDLNEAEREFIQAGLALRERQAGEQEARRRRELEVAQELAHSEKQRAEEQAQAAASLRRRAVWLTGVGLVAVLLAMAAGGFGWQSSQNAEQAILAEQTAEARRQQAETAQAEAVAAQQETAREARRARASQLAAQARLVLENDEDPSGTLPLLLAREAILTTLTEDGYFTPEADAALRQVVDSVPVLLQTFSGHTDRVVTADFSPDGKTLATGSADQTIRLWDVTTGQELHQLQGHTRVVWSLDFSPDGQQLVSAGFDNTVRLWDVATGAEIRRFEGHTGIVYWAMFSPDGKTIATSGGRISGSANPSLGRPPKFDDTIRLWDVASGKEIERIAASIPRNTISTHILGSGFSAYSPDGNTLITPGEDLTARLWDVATGEEIRRFEGHTGIVSGAIFSPEGKTIATASDDHTIRLWDVATGVEIQQFEGDMGPVTAANFSPDGQTIVVSSFDPTTERFDGIVRLWDVATGAEIYRLAGSTAGVTFATFSPDGRSIITTSESPDNTVRLWAATPKGERRRLEGHRSEVRSVAVSPDGRIIGTGGDDNRVRLWDAATGEELIRLEGHRGRVNAIAFSPDGHMLASAGFDKTIRLWDLETKQEIKRFEGHTGTIESLAFSPDGQSIATAAEDKTARLWDVATGEEIRRFEGHTAGVNAVAFRSDNQIIATGGADKTIRLWDVKTGEEIRRLKGHTSIVRSVDFSPDGQTLVSAGTTDTIVRLWDVDLGREIGQFEGHKSRVNVAVFSPNGQTAVSAGKDGSVLVWDVDSRSVIRRLEGHTSYVFAAAFSPDGQFIVSAGHDRTARIWPSVEKLLEEAGDLIQREPPEFTPEERTRFGVGE